MYFSLFLFLHFFLSPFSDCTIHFNTAILSKSVRTGVCDMPRAENHAPARLVPPPSASVSARAGRRAGRRVGVFTRRVTPPPPPLSRVSE